MKEKLLNLSNAELKKFLIGYLPAVAKSIKVDFKWDPALTCTGNLVGFTESEGYGDGHASLSWKQRENLWYRPGNALMLAINNKTGNIAITEENSSRNVLGIPIFFSLASAYLTCKQPQQEQPEMNNVKNTANKVLDANKTAVQVAAQLGVGKTANSFFLNKLVGKLPWYAKLFGKKNEITDNPVAKLVTAELAVTLSKHFAPDNKKLNYISDAMLQEAMVDVTVNSDVLKRMISELESMVSLPDLTEIK